MRKVRGRAITVRCSLLAVATGDSSQRGNAITESNDSIYRFGGLTP